jgi:hypothetical protein
VSPEVHVSDENELRAIIEEQHESQGGCGPVCGGWAHGELALRRGWQLDDPRLRRAIRVLDSEGLWRREPPSQTHGVRWWRMES